MNARARRHAARAAARRDAATPISAIMRSDIRRTRATSLVATQRDSAGRRSDWSRAASLRPVETAMTRAWSDTSAGQGTQYR